MVYEERKFNLPALDGISKESIDAHLGLYAGYVKNCNTLMSLESELGKDTQKNAIALAEIVRRFAFEYDGMRMHEYYFEQWESGVKTLVETEALGSALGAQFGNLSEWEKQFRAVGMMRGIGWAVLFFDPATKTFHNVWVGEHMQGHLVSLPALLILDVWEHAYVAQFGTGGRSAYIDAFFKNLNWEIMEGRFAKYS